MAIVTDPSDYKIILDEMKANAGSVALATRRRLAAKAFRLTNRYDGAIADYLEKHFLAS